MNETRTIASQRNLKERCQVEIVPADGLALWSAMASEGSAMNNCGPSYMQDQHWNGKKIKTYIGISWWTSSSQAHEKGVMDILWCNWYFF